ncbi:MAG: hypothetical protein IKL89_09005, partial [Clostridia bacterium]|nr:hypothetical protein [Clostridia bacterium]
LPLGEVAEQSEDGEGNLQALSVGFADSSPGGRAKRDRKTLREICRGGNLPPAFTGISIYG